MSQFRSTILSQSGGVNVPEEALSVLHQRLLMAEEQAESLVRDMGSFGVSRSEILETGDPVPQRIRRACEEGNETMPWHQQWDSMMSRICRMESVLQTLKLTTFRLETQRELDPSHSACLKEQLSTLQQESEEEQRASRRELMRLKDQLQQACVEREEAQTEYRRLGEALEVATTSKMDLALAAEELKSVKVQMSTKLTEMRQQLSEESALCFQAVKSQSELRLRVEEVEKELEAERRQTQLIQAECQALRTEGHTTRQRLQEETERARRLQEQYQKVGEQADMKDSLVAEFKTELKSARLALQKQQQEIQKLLRDGRDLRTAADRVQVLNNQLQGQCEELSSNLRALTVENARLLTDSQATVKAERSRVVKQLREQDLLLEEARRNIRDELQKALSDKVKLHLELDTLNVDHAQLKQNSMVVQETAVTQKELLEHTIERLRGELSAAVTERETLRRDRDTMCLEVAELKAERAVLEDQLSNIKQEAGSLSSALQRQQEENKRLVEKMADMQHQQLEPMKRLLDTARLDNRKLAQSLEHAEGTISKLNTTKQQQQTVLTHRETKLNEAQSQVGVLSERLEHQNRKDNDSVRRAAHRKISELKKSLEQSLVKSDDLSRANRELRENVSELEKVVTNQRARMREQKIQLKRHLQKKEALGSNHKLKDMEAELENLEALKEEHQNRLYEQRLVESIERLQRAKEAAEKKLRDATLESQQISESLEEANKWFRSRFDRQKRSYFREESRDRGDCSLGTYKEGTQTLSCNDAKAQSDGRANQLEEEQERWALTMQRWETKRELARVATGYKPGGVPPRTLTHTH